MLRVSDCIAEGVGFAIPEPTEWQHIGDEDQSRDDLCPNGFRNRIVGWSLRRAIAGQR
jgi:hypothetical protein